MGVKKIDMEEFERQLFQEEPSAKTLKMSLLSEIMRETASHPCIVCGRNPADSAASFRPRPEDAKRLGWPEDHQQMINVPICQDCDEFFQRNPVQTLRLEQEIINLAIARGSSIPRTDL
jgi:hypothetical protein